MLIINADDWGRSVLETDRALECFRAGRITSVSAMVFMQDSRRAAQLARTNGLDVGLHLNLTQLYNGEAGTKTDAEAQKRIVGFLTQSKYALLIYHPLLRDDFRRVFRAQFEEFVNLYGTVPSHIDGHQHMHLCMNLLVDRVIPAGQKIRRNFSYSAQEKGAVNRAYRSLADKWLGRSYRMTDYFFSLGECLQNDRLSRVMECSRIANVELMTHPVYEGEYGWLMSTRHTETVRGVDLAGYVSL